MNLTRLLRWRRERFVPRGLSREWRPPHMSGKWKDKMEERLWSAQVMIDVIDARAPMTSRNQRLTTKTTAPRIVLFNKTDLTQIDERQKEILINNEKLLGAEHVLFGSAVDTKSDLIQHSLIDVIKTLAGPERSSRGTIDCIITGLPNVGKGRGSPYPLFSVHYVSHERERKSKFQ